MPWTPYLAPELRSLCIPVLRVGGKRLSCASWKKCLQLCNSRREQRVSAVRSDSGKSEGSRRQSSPRINLKSNPEFFARLVAYSLLGSLVLKYGSLLTDVPFQPSPAVAALLIAGPTVIFSLVLAYISSQGDAMR